MPPIRLRPSDRPMRERVGKLGVNCRNPKPGGMGICSQGRQEWRQGSETRAWRPERPVKPHERAPGRPPEEIVAASVETRRARIKSRATRLCGNNSFECWFRGRWTGTFNRISDVRFWQSTAFAPSTGLQVFFNGVQETYLTPASVTSSIATSSVPTTDPGTANVNIGGSLTGCLTTSGYSANVVLQLRTTTAAAAGDTSLAVFTMSQWLHRLATAGRKWRELRGNLNAKRMVIPTQAWQGC